MREEKYDISFLSEDRINNILESAKEKAKNKVVNSHQNCKHNNDVENKSPNALVIISLFGIFCHKNSPCITYYFYYN